jgi:hypothetical protein
VNSIERFSYFERMIRGGDVGPGRGVATAGLLTIRLFYQASRTDRNCLCGDARGRIGGPSGRFFSP